MVGAGSESKLAGLLRSAQMLKALLEKLRRDVFKRDYSQRNLFVRFVQASTNHELLIRSVKETRFSDLVPRGLLRGVKRLMTWLVFVLQKKRALKLSRASRRYLRLSLRSFARDDIRESAGRLRRASSRAKAVLRALSRMERVAHTARNTARTVQIQIQKG